MIKQLPCGLVKKCGFSPSFKVISTTPAIQCFSIQGGNIVLIFFSLVILNTIQGKRISAFLFPMFRNIAQAPTKQPQGYKHQWSPKSNLSKHLQHFNWAIKAFVRSDVTWMAWRNL